MRVHLIGVAGTGMGQLAKLLRDAGHEVSGSDVSFDPPMGPALEAAGIRCLPGWSADNIGKDLELVVVGNAIRKDNVEAVRALELALPRTSMSGALRERFLAGKRPLVVAGTHGKTTTSAMCAWILEIAGLEPGFFIGGLPKNFDAGARAASSKRKIVGTSAKAAPFVVEGDEYDAVYWEKKPKFFDYVAPPGSPPDDVVIITSVEHDHIDIYPSAEVYERQFAELSAMVPEGGLIACDARDPRARAIVSAHARARTAFYAIDGDDTGDVTPTWLGAMVPPDPETGIQPFDLYLGGSYGGRFALKVPGSHNVRNAIGALAACAEGFGVDIEKARQALAMFEGVRRRQDLLGTPGGIAVYDDFAHHPTAVDETLRALRSRHPSGRALGRLRAAQRHGMPQHPSRRVSNGVPRGRPRALRAARTHEHPGGRAARRRAHRARDRRLGLGRGERRRDHRDDRPGSSCRRRRRAPLERRLRRDPCAPPS